MKTEIFDRMDLCTEEEVQRMLLMVSAQRREQALRFRHLHGRFCCLKSWLMLERMMAEEGITMTEWRYNENGKPFLTDGPFFSLSHCKAGIAVAVHDRPVGIDMETVRRADEDLIKRVMCAREQEQIHSADMPDRMFTRLWTRKEAVVKAQGVGIVSFEQLQSVLENGGQHILTIEKENYIYSLAYE